MLAPLSQKFYAPPIFKRHDTRRFCVLCTELFVNNNSTYSIISKTVNTVKQLISQYSTMGTHIISLVGQKLYARTYQRVGALVTFEIIIVSMMTEWVKALDFSSQPRFKSRPNFFNFFTFNFVILIDSHRLNNTF